MKIGIVGGGYAGVISSLLIKKSHPDYEVLVFEKNDQIGKKIKATGNGKCNINNINDDEDRYNNADFILDLMDKYDIKTQIKVLRSLGLYLKEMNNGGLYPISESANNVVEILSAQLDALQVKTYLETKVLDYQLKEDGIDVVCDNHTFHVDKLIISTGGMSTPNLGSDGNFIPILKQHRYVISDFRPGLCPIKVADHVKTLFGERVKANVKVIVNNKELFDENGEVNFKKDGLSGIVIMNASSYIAKNNLKGAIISLKVIHDLKEKDLMELSKTLPNPLLTIVNTHLADYIYARAKVEQHLNLSEYECEKLFKVLNGIRFRFESLYDFKESQVSVGGVTLDNLDLKSLESKIEKNVYFIGETVDIDGLCGGYNMKWCLLSALLVKDSI